MKKILIFALSAFILLGSGIAIGSSLNGDYNGNPIVKVTSGGKTLTDEVPAQIIDGKTMVPLTMLRNLGFNVTWNANDYSVEVKQKHELTEAELKKIAESVGVVYGSTDDPNKFNQGSGFILSNGVLITNYHVGGDSNYLQIDIEGKWTKTNGSLLFKNKATDVMGVKIESQKALPYSTDLPKQGDEIYAIGYPGKTLQITSGVVKSILTLDGNKMIIHNAKTNQGSSGGILLNDKGEVIGVTSAGYLYQGEYIDQAIPIYYVIDELNKLR